MWIRSQDRRVLVENKMLVVMPRNSGKCHVVNYVGYDSEIDSNNILGEYDSEEQAMTVMDSIEQCLFKGNMIYLMPTINKVEERIKALS